MKTPSLKRIIGQKKRGQELEGEARDLGQDAPEVGEDHKVPMLSASVRRDGLKNLMRHEYAPGSRGEINGEREARRSRPWRAPEAKQADKWRVSRQRRKDTRRHSSSSFFCSKAEVESTDETLP